eukprot:278190_1
MSADSFLTALIDIFESNANSTVNFKCVCGSLLIHSWDNVICDVCKADADPDVNMWSCPCEYNVYHPDGYDVCDKCITNHNYHTHVTEVTEQKQDSNIPIQISHNKCAKHQNCGILQRFTGIMNRYQQDQVAMVDNTDKSQLTQIMDDFLHLMNEHDDDDQFRFIFEILRHCDMTNCIMFKRNNRNRMRLTADATHDIVQSHHGAYRVGFDILDKMHCYFQHSYDMGHRVFINCKNEEFEPELPDQLKQSNSYPTPRNIPLHFTDNAYNKYNGQLLSIDNTNEQVYGHGVPFYYNYPGESRSWDDSEYSYKEVSPKYCSLKEEVTQNPFAVLTQDQFTHEYEKAMVLFDTRHRKKSKHFEPHHLYNQRVEFTVQNVLALMLYCNYLLLQYEFSKTYRINDGNDHVNFYYWGKLMKISIKLFGNMDRNVTKFYHGVDKKFRFEAYVGGNIDSGIEIGSPMSTSTSFAVAQHFSNYQGLIIELRRSTISARRPSWVTTEGMSYLSLAWLSNFSGEKECLFLQNSPFVYIA